jgi:hypothetical protein
LARTWLLVLLAIAVGGAAITTVCLDDYPAFAESSRGMPFYSPWTWAMGLLLAVAPLVWLGAIASPGPETLTALRAHAALYSVLLVITAALDSPGHSSPMERWFALLVWYFLSLVLGIEGLAAVVAWVRMRKSTPGKKAPPFVYFGLTSALLGGWFCGILIWSTLVPARVIAAAETAAGGRPYCIDVEKGPARSAGDLNGWRMRATNHEGWIWHFHALLVIGDAADRRYMNWSYRTGRFEPVRERLRLDRGVKCTPKAHLAREWL